MKIVSGLFAALFISASLSLAQTSPQQTLLVLSKRDHTLAIVDPATLKVIAKAPVGEDPHEVIASSDGRTAYVSNYGFGAYHTLTVIDLVNRKQAGVIDLGPLRGPHGLAFVGGKPWFTAEGAKAIGRYDPETQKVDWILGTGQNRTHMIWVSPDMTQIYTSNVSSGTVSIIDRATQPGGPGRPPRTDWNETVVPVGRGSEGFDVRPDGKELWVGNAGDGTISIIDLATKRVSETVPANVSGVNRLKFTPDGKLVVVACLSNSGIIVLDAATHKELKRFPTPGAGGIQMQPDGARAYISVSAANYVTVLDLKTLEMVGRIDAGPEPDGIAWCVRAE